MRTAIFTASSETTLTIKTSEVLDLVRMGQSDPFTRLSPGVTAVTVPAGVFKVVSNTAVKVTAETTDVKVVATLSNKGDWPDLTQAAHATGSDPHAVMSFLADAKWRVVE